MLPLRLLPTLPPRQPSIIARRVGAQDSERLARPRLSIRKYRIVKARDRGLDRPLHCAVQLLLRGGRAENAVEIRLEERIIARHANGVRILDLHALLPLGELARKDGPMEERN